MDDTKTNLGELYAKQAKLKAEVEEMAGSKLRQLEAATEELKEAEAEWEEAHGGGSGGSYDPVAEGKAMAKKQKAPTDGMAFK